MTTNETNNLAVVTEPARNNLDPNKPGPSNPGPNKPGPNNPGPAFNKRAIATAAILIVCTVLAIVSGLHSRVKAETRLRENAQASAIP
jgi:hypothetical protein